MEIENIKKVHFVGIGGVGISAVAKLMLLKGKKVSGSDISSSPIVKNLEELGIKINIGHDSKNIGPDTDLVVQTIAVPKDNPEIIEAQNKKIEIKTYPEMLSIISKDLDTIAISGTHGKTTTTAMLSKVLIDANLDPTVIVGSMMKESDSNLVVGNGKYFLVEACEYKRSFLNLYPKILVITNIDLDHLDYYKDLEDIQSAFRELAVRVPKEGVVICDATHPKVLPVIKNLTCRVIDYTKLAEKKLKLKVGGEHNQQNALACLAVSGFLLIDKEKAMNSLENFSGTWRRFDLRGKTKKGALVYDDYAHHPKELETTLRGTREMYPDSKIIGFFQPHLFSRTKLLLDDFSKAFTDLDEIFVLPIYPAREEFDASISSEMLVEKIIKNGKTAHLVESQEKAIKIINELDDKTVVINLGAGDIYKISEAVTV